MKENVTGFRFSNKRKTETNFYRFVSEYVIPGTVGHIELCYGCRIDDNTKSQMGMLCCTVNDVPRH